MSKFARTQERTQVHGVITSTTPVPTYEGGEGHARDAKSELFLLAVSNMVKQDTFYEQASSRDSRFRDLIAQVAVEDHSWLARFVPYLRDKLNMRSASVVMAAEYAATGAPGARAVINSACVRADEPAELLAYWHVRFGRRVPKPVKRGLADAVRRLYNERAVLRYDGKASDWRMGDVVELVHPKPVAGWQSALFKYLLDRRHNRPDVTESSSPIHLPTIHSFQTMQAIPVANRRKLVESGDVSTLLKDAGMSWESLSGWLQGPMDAAAWEAIIPSMGYMALLRNLRNFDDAGVSDEVKLSVARRLADPEQVAKSRQFPVRFYSAWAHTQSMEWGPVLEKALDLSMQNVVSLPGRTLLLVDVSGSMVHDPFINRFHGTKAGQSVVKPWHTASIFGAALAKRAEHADLYSYGQGEERIPVTKSTSILRVIDAIEHSAPFATGTQTLDTLARTFDNHNRVIILTDEQAFASHHRHSDFSRIPVIYTWNLAGYKQGHVPSGSDGRYTFGGLNDAAFVMLEALEGMRDGAWPF